MNHTPFCFFVFALLCFAIWCCSRQCLLFRSPTNSRYLWDLFGCRATGNCLLGPVTYLSTDLADLRHIDLWTFMGNVGLIQFVPSKPFPRHQETMFIFSRRQSISLKFSSSDFVCVNKSSMNSWSFVLDLSSPFSSKVGLNCVHFVKQTVLRCWTCQASGVMCV